MAPIKCYLPLDQSLNDGAARKALKTRQLRAFDNYILFLRNGNSYFLRMLHFLFARQSFVSLSFQ